MGICGKKPNTGVSALSDGGVRQHLSNRIERIALLGKEHINDCLFEWHEHDQSI
jgi:hypothetical protein